MRKELLGKSGTELIKTLQRALYSDSIEIIAYKNSDAGNWFLQMGVRMGTELKWDLTWNSEVYEW